MLYHLLPPLSDLHIVFNVFRFQTFRAAGAVVTALVLAFLLGPMTIRWLTRIRFGQVIRDLGPESHQSKAGTPTMGGVLIILSTLVSTLLWARLDVAYTAICLAALLWMGAIGFLDDYLKVVRKETAGLVGRYKLVGQGLFALSLGGLLLLAPLSDYPASSTSIPFFSDYLVVFWPPLFVLFVAVVVTGSSNAVNLTDGLDGLAAGLGAIAAASFGVFAYLSGNSLYSSYLGILYLPAAGEMAIFATALAGASVGFLWYNAHPAQVFMGDTGSLALGGAIAVIAILLKSEFLLVIVGGVFVVEALSVIVQTGWFKVSKRQWGEGRRVFLMAPIHHHFEKLGWPESKVVIRFWILGILFAMLGFSTLKLR